MQRQEPILPNQSNIQQLSTDSTSPVNSSRGTLQDDSNQVVIIEKALSTASTLGRVTREPRSQSTPPAHNQILVRALKRNLSRRLSQISLIPSAEESTSGSFAPPSTSFSQFPLSSESSPRTSSPIDFIYNPLAPQTPVSPSNSLDSVFFPDNARVPSPINESVLNISIHSNINSSTTMVLNDEDEPEFPDDEPSTNQSDLLPRRSKRTTKPPDRLTYP